MIILDFDIQGKVVLTCDRCLGDLDFPISTTHQVIVKYGKGDKEQDNDILYLADEEYQLDVSTLIYENIVLSIPIRNVHPDDENGDSTCDEEQISLLNQYSKRTTNDPRWNALKNLKLED